MNSARAARGIVAASLFSLLFFTFLIISHWACGGGRFTWTPALELSLVHSGHVFLSVCGIVGFASGGAALVPNFFLFFGTLQALADIVVVTLRVLALFETASLFCPLTYVFFSVALLFTALSWLASGLQTFGSDAAADDDLSTKKER